MGFLRGRGVRAANFDMRWRSQRSADGAVDSKEVFGMSQTLKEVLRKFWLKGKFGSAKRTYTFE